jgi:serine/threonine-protein kinase
LTRAPPHGDALGNVAEQRPETLAPEARIGQTLNGKWHVDRLLDVGGMGAVYVATHRNGRRAAIKMLHRQFAANAEIRRRFQREGYVANKIEHPGAVAILDDDVSEDGAPYLVLELLEGESLSAWLDRVGGRLPVPDVLAIAGQVLDVLSVAHAAAIVHRDIKPGNIFVTKGGYTKLLDFGLARIRDGNISLIPTAHGTVMGTAGYMAPEQARGKVDEVDARTDVFSVGAVMFRALTGRRIHEKATAFDTTLAAMKDPAPLLASLVPDIDPLLAAVVDKALSFDKTARWATAREMFDALRSVYDQSGAQRGSQGAIPTSTVPRITEPSLVISVAFGDHHDEVLERERRRIREVAESLTVFVEPDPKG